MFKQITIATLLALLGSVSTSYAVELQYNSGGLKIESSITGSDPDGQISVSDIDYMTSPIMIENGVEYVTSNTSSNANGNSSFGSFSNCDVMQSDFFMSGGLSTYSYSENTDHTAVARVSTYNSDNEPGYYIVIAPTEEGEKIGDRVKVKINLNPSLNVTGDSMAAWIKGLNGASQFCLALNPELDENGMPNSESIIFAHDNITTSTMLQLSDEIEINARVGDVIGIYLEAGCSSHQTDTQFRNGNVQAGIFFEVSMLKNPADINNDGVVNIGDLAILAANWLWTRDGEDTPLLR